MRYFSIFLFIVIFSVISCNRETNNNADKSIFKYNESAGIVNLDPAFARDQAHIWVCNQLYNSLVSLDDDLIIKPSIAKNWDISEDGREYVFNLRDDVFFHENKVFGGEKRKLKADDFVYSFKRLLSEKLASPGAWTLSKIEKGKNGDFSINAPNDTTLIIKLSQPFPPFLGILSMQYCSAVPYEAVEYYQDEFGRNPVGTGPFFMKNWEEGIKLVLRKNLFYFEFDGDQRLPYLDAVSVSFIIDKMTAFLELVKGNIDFMSGLDASYKDELLNHDGSLKKKYSEKLKVIGEPYLNTEYLAILVDPKFVGGKPLDNLKIRQAINYGFDREKMIKYLRNNIGVAGTSGIIPKGMPSYVENANYGYSYNPQKSRSLLNESGYFEFVEKPDIKLVTTAEYLDLCKYVQSQLGELGMEIGVEVSPAAAMREMKANSKIQFFRASWIADYPDAENYLSLFYSKNFAPNGPNYTHYSNSSFDELYEKAILENDFETRNLIYRHMDSLVMTDSPVVVLFYDESIRFVRKEIYGMTSNPINLLNLKNIRKQD